MCPSFGLAAPLAVATVRVLLAVPVRSGFGLRRSPFPLTGPLFAGLTEPVLSGRWCLSDRCSVADGRIIAQCGGMCLHVCSRVRHSGGKVAVPAHVCQGAAPWGQGGLTVGTSRHIQLSVGCAWLAAVYIHAPGVLAVCMPPAPRHCHEGDGGTAPAFGRVECVMGMPTAPNDEEGV